MNYSTRVFISKQGLISEGETPKSFTRLSSRREDKIVSHHTGVYGQRQKAFQKLALVRDTRALISSHIVYQKIATSAAEDLEVNQESVTDSLQRVFLP